MQVNPKSSFLNPQQIQNTNDLMAKTFRIWAFGFRYCLGFRVSARDELGRVDLAFNSCLTGAPQHCNTAISPLDGNLTSTYGELADFEARRPELPRETKIGTHFLDILEEVEDIA